MLRRFLVACLMCAVALLAVPVAEVSSDRVLHGVETIGGVLTVNAPTMPAAPYWEPTTGFWDWVRFVGTVATAFAIFWCGMDDDNWGC